MNIVIPMAGLGSRFVDAGYEIPKPLIPVQGEPMYAWALKGLPLDLSTNLVFLCLNEHLEKDNLRQDIEERYNKYAPQIIGINGVTQGQACTVLLAKRIIDSNEPLLIHNADTWFSSELRNIILEKPKEIDGIVTVFEEYDSRWSFARIDSDGLIKEVVEKKPISKWATAGMYYFSRGSGFVVEAEAMITEKQTSKGEYYVGPLYNRMINKGKRIIPDYAKEVGCMGTPQDLKEFCSRQEDRPLKNIPRKKPD